MQSKRWKARKKISKKQGAVKTHCDHNHHHNHYNRNLHACTSHAIHFSSSATWCYVFSTGMKSNCIHGKQVFQSCNRLARVQVPETDGFVIRAWRGRWGAKNYSYTTTRSTRKNARAKVTELQAADHKPHICTSFLKPHASHHFSHTQYLRTDTSNHAQHTIHRKNTVGISNVTHRKWLSSMLS